MSGNSFPKDPWGDFWVSTEGAHGGGCLPTRWDGIDTAQRQAWQEFAKLLPKAAYVLDLATGDGRVMGWLLGVRRDLKLVGVDLAPRIPQPPKGSRSRAGISMEALPFGDASQDAITSQFGFEYGDTDGVLREIMRVLKPGGRVGLMTHRLDGPILEHNRPRREGLLWVVDEIGLIAKARASLALRALVPGVPSVIRAAPQEAARQFGAGSAGWELAEAILQTLAMGHNDHPQNVLGLLNTLEAKARNEIGRIDSLEGACRSIADQDALTRRFGEAELQIDSHRLVKEDGGGQPFADMWTLRKGVESRRTDAS